MMETDQPSKCADLREDYFECLHHRKEVSFPFFSPPLGSSSTGTARTPGWQTPGC